jgi:anti-anti-sigma factor
MTSHPHRRARRTRRRPFAQRRARVRGPRHSAPAPDPVRVSFERHARVALLHVSGEFDLGAVASVERALERAVDGPTDDVVFDLRAVSFLDVSGLKTLIRADDRARGEAFSVHVVPPAGLAARIFTLTSLGQALDLVDELPGES